VSTLVGAQIVTPGDWADLDLDPATRHRSIVSAVRRAVASDVALAGYSVRLITLLDDVARRAYDSGGFFCSSLVLSSDDGVLVANVLMQLSDGVGSGGVDGSGGGDGSGVLGGPGAAIEVCAGLAAAVSCDPDWEDADVTVVTLPLVGPAVRVEVVDGGVCVQYLVPVPDSSQQIVLTFTSPCPPFAGALIELFDSMAASFALEYAGDDCVPADSAAPNG